MLSPPSVVPLFAKLARTGLALLAVEQCDIADAEEQYVALKGWSSTMSPLDMVRVDRVLGLLAQAMGNLGRAMAHFEDALAFCRKSGWLSKPARTCHDFAVGLLQRKEAGDWTKAISLLDESLSISADLGMRPLMARVIALQVLAETQRARGPVYPNGLTPREVEVLRLIPSVKNPKLPLGLKPSMDHVIHNPVHVP